LRDTIIRLSSLWTTVRRKKYNQVLRDTIKRLSSFWATVRRKKYNQVLKDRIKVSPFSGLLFVERNITKF